MTDACRKSTNSRPISISNGRAMALISMPERGTCGGFCEPSCRTLVQNRRAERSCRMISMRAIVVLAALLSLAAPGVSYRAIELQSPISVTLALKASTAPVPEQHRVASGKADQPLFFGVAPRVYRANVPFSEIDFVATPSHEPPSLDRHGPPLAPRPPPL